MTELLIAVSKPTGILGFDHKYILYQNSAGEKFIIRGGPEYTRNNSVIADANLGKIITEVARYNQNNGDWDDHGTHVSQILLETDDLSSTFKEMSKTARAIESWNIPYGHDQNSNSVVDTVLASVGITVPDMFGVHTTLDGRNIPYPLVTPGSGTILSPEMGKGAHLPHPPRGINKYSELYGPPMPPVQSTPSDYSTIYNGATGGQSYTAPELPQYDPIPEKIDFDFGGIRDLLSSGGNSAIGSGSNSNSNGGQGPHGPSVWDRLRSNSSNDTATSTGGTSSTNQGSYNGSNNLVSPSADTNGDGQVTLEEAHNDGVGSGHSEHPLLLDLDGNGVQIDTLDTSNFFFDMTNDGLQNQTAWAGAGNGEVVETENQLYLAIVSCVTTDYVVQNKLNS